MTVDISYRDYALKYLEQTIRDYVPHGKRRVEMRYYSYMHAINLYLYNYILNQTGEDDDIIEVLERKRKEFYDSYTNTTKDEKNWFLGVYEDTVCLLIDVLLVKKYKW